MLKEALCAAAEDTLARAAVAVAAHDHDICTAFAGGGFRGASRVRRRDWRRRLGAAQAA